MIDADTTLALALHTARAEGREVHSIKDLLCDFCGTEVATRDGYCDGCNAELTAHYDERGRYLCEEDDDEGAVFLAGINPGKF